MFDAESPREPRRDFDVCKSQSFHNTPRRRLAHRSHRARESNGSLRCRSVHSTCERRGSNPNQARNTSSVFELLPRLHRSGRYRRRRSPIQWRRKSDCPNHNPIRTCEKQSSATYWPLTAKKSLNSPCCLCSARTPTCSFQLPRCKLLCPLGRRTKTAQAPPDDTHSSRTSLGAL